MGKLFEELKRRKVFRLAVVYAAVGWVLAQVAAFAVETFAAPQWVQQIFVVFLILGFPLALILAWAYEVTPEGIKPDSSAQHVPVTTNNRDRKLIYATFILVLLAVGFQLADRFLFSSVNQTERIASDGAASGAGSYLSRRFNINIGGTRSLPNTFAYANIALSADGDNLVYRVFRPETQAESLYLKNLNQLGEQVLVNGLANTPFFSADGEWVGYSQLDGGELYKQSIRGGTPLLIADSTRGGSGGFWSADDTVYYTSSNLQLMRVSANGGVPEPLNINVVDTNSVQSWPYLLPGDDALLYTVASPNDSRDGRIDLLVQSTGKVSTIIQSGYNARYVPTGHIVFVRDETLWAVPFDADRLQITGPQRPVIQGIQTNTRRGGTPYAFSEDGLLVYLPGEDTRPTETTLIWVDREGKEEALRRPVPDVRRWAVSPDGGQLALSVGEDGTNSDIWIYNLTRHNLSRLTVDESDDYRPLWTPDGERVVFGSARDGGGLWWRAADGTGVAERLLKDSDLRERGASPYAFTPDGTQLVYWSGYDLYTLTPGDELSSKPLIKNNFFTQRPDLSPDGRWIAYVSNKTGSQEVYVSPFPNVDDGNEKISTEGGTSPKWSPDGLELFFTTLFVTTQIMDSSVMVARRETTDTSQFAIPVRAFEGSDAVVSSDATFDISADGSRLLLRRETKNTVQDTEVTLLVAVDNWFEELNRLAPPDPQ